MADQLEFLFALDAKLGALPDALKALEEAQAALKQADTATKAFDAQFGKLNQTLKTLKRPQQLDDLKKQIEALEHPAKHTEGILQHFLHATLEPLESRMARIAEFEFIRRGVDALIEAPMEALHLFKELFEEMVKVSAEAERTDKSFQLMFGAGEGKETLEWIESISKFTEFTGRELKGAAQDLAKVGFEGEGLTRAMAASVDIAAFDKSGEAGLSGALGSMARIKRTGRVEGRTLAGVGVTNEDFYAELARRTGKGTAVLKKEMEQGKIAAETSLEALYSTIAKRTGKDLGGAGVEMSTTLQAKLKHLQEVPEKFFEQLRSSKGFAAISDFVGKIVDALDPDGPSGRRISASLSSIFDTIGEKLNGIDVTGTINSVVTTLTNLPSTMRPVIVAFESIYDVLKGIVFVISNIPGIHELIELAKSTSATDKSYRSALNTFDKGTKSNWGAPDPDSPEWLTKGKGMGKKLEEGTRGALGAHSPSTVFEDIGKNVGEGFDRGIATSMGASDNVARGAFAIPAPTGAARGQTTIQIEVNTTVHASGDGHQIAQQVSDQIREIIPGALQSAIEQLAGQAGSA